MLGVHLHRAVGEVALVSGSGNATSTMAVVNIACSRPFGTPSGGMHCQCGHAGVAVSD